MGGGGGGGGRSGRLNSGSNTNILKEILTQEHDVELEYIAV